jgi:glycosyltransferase involved in cell wall biosynthesis
MRFNVLIATHRRAELLERTLQSLVAARKPAGFERVIIVENGEAEEAQQICERLATTLPLQYWHHPQPGKGRSIQWALEQLGNGFALFLDDDVRVCEDLVPRYMAAAQAHGRGHFFGGPLRIDYEVEPVAWLKNHLPNSAIGWVPQNPNAPLQGTDRFLGANFGAFVEDVLGAGGFRSRHGPGALFAGTAGNPTGLEYELQDRLLARGCIPIYVDGAAVWHYVPGERCNESWALHRMFRNELSRIVRSEGEQARKGSRLCRVPVRVWLRYIQAVVLAMLGRLSPNAERRFLWDSRLHKARGRIRGYRLGGIE